MSGTGDTVKVVVVDDQVLIRAGLTALLRAAPGVEVVGEATTGEDAIVVAEATKPHVVLMDVRMPGIGGIAATRRILSTGDDPPRVIMLTTFDLDEYVYQALRAGASGFLLKDIEPERLLTAIATVAGGDLLFAPAVVRRLVEAYCDGVGAEQQRTPDLGQVTARERDVVRLVAKGLSNSEIATVLTIGEATVKTHVNRAMAKLRLTSRAQIVVAAYESGLVRPRSANPPTA